MWSWQSFEHQSSQLGGPGTDRAGSASAPEICAQLDKSEKWAPDG